MQNISIIMDIDKIIKYALEEDIGSGDITSNSIIPKDKKAKAILKSKDVGILCGIDLAKKIFHYYDNSLIFKSYFNDGDIIKNGDIIAEISGSAISILTCERTVLNFIQRLSGVATTANKYQKLIEAYGVKILDTRKTSPLIRPLEKYAVKIGGGQNHRFGLFDMVLIKDNHIEVAGSIVNAVLAARKKNPGVKIEVETETIEMVKDAIESKADRIMLDNMDNVTMKKAVSLIKKSSPNIEIEASGGINFENIIEKAKTGVNFISIGSALTNASKSLDISLDVVMN
jgi:nicotinate-nucleotide pyrophosphorylase (carboxylating)